MKAFPAAAPNMEAARRLQPTPFTLALASSPTSPLSLPRETGDQGGEDAFGEDSLQTDASGCIPRLSSQDSFTEEREEQEEEQGRREEQEEEQGRREEQEAAAKERAAQKQLLATEELLQSERNYLRMLEICSGTIRRNLQEIQPPLDNLDSLFLYIDDVMDVSRRFLRLLDRENSEQLGATPTIDTLCEAFLSLSPDLEVSYREYLSNYSRVSDQENVYKQKEELWNHMIKVIKESAPEVNATSLTFFLVMPVQRIARYPLLLQTIQKHTDPAHPAYELLQRTTHTSVALNCRINEYKRFREVADKYRKSENLTIKDKIYRLNSHSIAKKTARLSQQLKHETGMAVKLVDEQFDALEGFFSILENGILQLLDNVELYLHHLQMFLSCRPEEFDLDMDGEKTPVCYKEISTALRQWILPSFEGRVRTLILKPLRELRELLKGPRNLIRKRLDKLLDYELIDGKPSLSYEEQAVANTYRTMNSLLLTELPLCNAVLLHVLWGTLGTFCSLHRDVAADVQQLFFSFAQQLPHSSVSTKAFWEWADSAVLDGARRLQTLCRRVGESLNAPAVQPLSVASQQRLQQLTERHGSQRLYQLLSTVVGGRDLDLNLSKGELVAVISEADTRGDKRRWLVDAGDRRGYVPSSKLIRYHLAMEAPPPSPHLTLPEAVSPARRHSYTPDIKPVARPPGVQSVVGFQFMAAYDFTSRGNREVSVGAGEAVRLLEPHDKRGNSEWSLVETSRGHRGYVPSNYLTIMPMGAGPR